MAAYMVCTMKIHDPETYRQYTALTPETLASHGGKFLTRGDPIKTCEGEEFTERMVILEFPDKAAAVVLVRRCRLPVGLEVPPGVFGSAG